MFFTFIHFPPCLTFTTDFVFVFFQYQETIANFCLLNIVYHKYFNKISLFYPWLKIEYKVKISSNDCLFTMKTLWSSAIVACEINNLVFMCYIYKKLICTNYFLIIQIYKWIVKNQKWFFSSIHSINQCQTHTDV